MNQLLSSFIVGFAAAAAFTTAGAADANAGTARPATIDIKWATPANDEPVAEPEEELEEEMMLRGVPDLENRPKR